MDGDKDIGSDNMLEIASLCEINECDEDGGEDGLFATVTCVGRVRLDSLQHSHPFFKFSCSQVKDAIGDIDKCNYIADNLEALISTLSRREQELGLHDSYDDIDLLRRYRNAFGAALEADHVTKNESIAVQILSAVSWAAFTSVENPELEHYRTKALDWESLFDRLKLAQYMLYEKQLRLQGYAIRVERAPCLDDKSFSEGFQ